MNKKEFLDAIRQIESSGGKDIDHDIIKHGLHKGSSAIGEYGLMPNTIKEFINRRKAKGRFGPDEALMSQMSPEQLKQFLQDQDRVEQNLASDVADRVLRRSKGDIEKAAYMWNQGHNKLASSIDQNKLDSSDYIKKFRQLKESLGRKRAIASEK